MGYVDYVNTFTLMGDLIYTVEAYDKNVKDLNRLKSFLNNTDWNKCELEREILRGRIEELETFINDQRNRIEIQIEEVKLEVAKRKLDKKIYE